MFVSVTIAVFAGFIAGVFVCLAWRQASCINCSDNELANKKLKQENSILRNSIAMIQAHRVQQIKKKLERRRKSKG